MSLNAGAGGGGGEIFRQGYFLENIPPGVIFSRKYFRGERFIFFFFFGGGVKIYHYTSAYNDLKRENTREIMSLDRNTAAALHFFVRQIRDLSEVAENKANFNHFCYRQTRKLRKLIYASTVY